LIVLGAIGSAVSSGNGSGNGSDSGSPANVAATGSAPITDRISGAFQDRSGCLGCGSLVQYIHVDKIWCAWQDNEVIIHVGFRNDSVEHVTVAWHPSYVIAGGATHGEGLGSIQSTGLDAHSTRTVIAKQSPEGVPAGSAIAQCEPAFSTVDSG
jgi:hypothetical protein